MIPNRFYMSPSDSPDYPGTFFAVSYVRLFYCNFKKNPGKLLVSFPNYFFVKSGFYDKSGI